MSVKTSPISAIKIRGARQNNLKNLDIDIPIGKLTVVTGLSGSGKSSLAFETLYAEGQRRYVETFSPYARQFLDRMDKPSVDSIEGIPPAIAIQQANNVRTSRSTVGTMTEINDYLKLLYANLAKCYSPKTGREIKPDSPSDVWNKVAAIAHEQDVLITFSISLPKPNKKPKKGATPLTFDELFSFVKAQGYLRVLIDGKIIRTDEPQHESLSTLDPAQFASLDVIQDRIRVEPAARTRFIEAVESAYRYGRNRCAIIPNFAGSLTRSESIDLHRAADLAPHRITFSNDWYSPDDNKTFRAPTPSLFSFNNPLGACPHCKGFGRVIEIDYHLALPDKTKSIAGGVVKPFQTESGKPCQKDLLAACKKLKIPTQIPFSELPKQQQEIIIRGENGKVKAEELWENKKWYGVRGYFEWLERKSYKMHVRVQLARYRSYQTCPTCHGRRFNGETEHYKIAGLSIADMCMTPLDRLVPTLQSLDIESTHDAALMLREEILSRLGYLRDVGLGYLILNRSTRTLSGGETVRVNLTSCLGTSLVNTLFVLDEPTVGLHPRDIGRLVDVMGKLRDRGNTVVVVEHEQAVMHAADHIIDIGPGSGHMGGEIIFQGTYGKLLRAKNSLTSDYLSGRKKIAESSSVIIAPDQKQKTDGNRFKPSKNLSIYGAQEHNLRGVDVDIPLEQFVCVTGVSGSGKSTLVHDCLYKNLLKARGQSVEDPGRVSKISGAETLGEIILVDQSPLTRTPRSTPALHTGIFDTVRNLFATTDNALSEGINAGYFSFNSGEGRCPTCGGSGYQKIEMQFLSDVFIKCPSCHGRRFQPFLLKIKYRGKSIADVLEMTIDEAVTFFDGQNKITRPLKLLQKLGLGYLALGQPLNTLSGGESQRLKLVGYIGGSEDTHPVAPAPAEAGPESMTRSDKRPTKINDDDWSQEADRARSKSKGDRSHLKNLFIFDEPTTGLHFEDIRKLVTVFRELVAAGHSLLVIEHNIDVIAASDWVIDLGPDSGEDGGLIVATGTPGQIAQYPESHTGQALKRRSRPPSLMDKDQKAASRLVSDRLTKSGRKNIPIISISGARHHNLKNITCSIPRSQMVVVTGPSGSGKSTLAFDIIFAEGQRRFMDSMSAYARQFVEQMEKPDVDSVEGIPPTVAIEQNVTRGGGKSTVATVTEIYHFMRLLWSKLGIQYDPDAGVPVGKQSTAEVVTRVRKQIAHDDLLLLAPLVKARKGFHTDVAQWAAKKGIAELRVDGKLVRTEKFTKLSRYQEHSIEALVGILHKGRPKESEIRGSVSSALKLGKGTFLGLDNHKRITVFSTERFCPETGRSYEELDPRMFSYNSPHGWCPTCKGYGVVHREPDEMTPEEEAHLDGKIAQAIHEGQAHECPTCHGQRLNRDALAVRLSGKSIGEVAGLPVNDAESFFAKLKFKGGAAQIAQDIIPEILSRLKFMKEVGLDYLQLGRSANTLSGGESQRIRLSAQLGSNLQGVLYVLDEPTIGLHPRDNDKLLDTLESLKAKGNSLLIVEHDEDTMRRADHIIDLGPGAGIHGGEIIAEGHWKEIARNKDSATAHYLKNPMSHPLHGKWREIDTQAEGRKRHKKNSATACVDTDTAGFPVRFLEIKNARVNNLHGINFSIPAGRLTVVTGVSGSGKSTSIREVLIPAVREALNKRTDTIKTHLWQIAHADIFDAVYEVDQSPIGKTPRSTPATYVGFLDTIRELFAKVPSARIRGYTHSRFSYNSKGGRCEVCQGAGMIKMQMQFLPTAYVHCETCNGKRFNQETLDILYHGKSIADVLDMSVEEAADFFANVPPVARPLKLLLETGLGYLKLGQQSPTLSGGEAQRLKLVTELARRDLENLRGPRRTFKPNLYCLEEPTIGLHMSDVKRLIEVIHRLVDAGHSVVVIEHHLDIIAEADWVIDIGPEGGAGGGKAIFEGCVTDLLKHKSSHTARYLRKHLES